MACSLKDEAVMVGRTRFATGPVIVRQLKNVTACSLFVCTAGPEIAGRAQELLSGPDPLKGYVFDTIGSEVVEAAMDMVQETIGRELREQGLSMSNRFSPGYCGWPTVEQHALFTLFGGSACGVTLTPSALMQPVKSISGLFGIGRNVPYLAYACGLCDKKDCYKRRTAGKDCRTEG